MNIEEFLDYHRAIIETCHAIVNLKNKDYCGKEHRESAFANFERVEKLGICSTETGILSRMSDKIARLITFSQKGELEVKDEQVEDTVCDLINYAIFFAAVSKAKKGH